MNLLQRISISILSITLLSFALRAQQDIHFDIDLREVEDDKIAVAMDVSSLELNEMTFCLPSIVPGIYGRMDFGQYLSGLTATDKKGRVVEVNRLDTNRWQLSSEKIIAEIKYRVDDGWEVFDMNMERGFYRSASSSFSDDHFILNTNTVFGFIQEYDQSPIAIRIKHAPELYAATGIMDCNRQLGELQAQAKDYHELVDSPIMIAVPDTSIIHMDGIEVEVACFSTTGEKIAGRIADHVRPLLDAQREYLGGELPVSRYSFIIYHNLNEDKNSWLGDGLEHSLSTLILLCMPLDMEVIMSNVYGIASHEFFHTVMPLGIHSHEIADYDFINPEMSQHLWLYEGMTEYFTIHMPTAQGLVGMDELLKRINEKAAMMHEFDSSLSLTDLSKHAMEMQDQYYNVYLKGALVALCMDIELRSLSDGDYGVQNLIQALLKQYGPDHSFEDDELFAEIVQLSGYEELGAFVDDYIVGTKELALEAYLASVGLDFDVETSVVTALSNPSPEQLSLRNAWLGN